MKKFIFRILLFFIFIAVCDYAFGLICSYLNKSAIGGDTKSHYYASMESDEEVIILGSSRAIHHYIPSILSDSLNMSVYNSGVDGNGIILQYGRLKMITSRYTPKLIIYDTTVSFDIENNDNLKYLNWLKRFYDSEGIDSIFMDISYNEKYKMNSNFYRYNTSFIQMLSDNINPQQIVLEGGYKPIYGTMNYTPDDIHQKKITQWDPLKLKYFKKMIELCHSKGIKLIISYSPFYNAKSSECYLLINNLCKEYNIPVIDFYSNNFISSDISKFKDTSHLNNDGAIEFTNTIAPIIKDILANPSNINN